MAKYYVSSGNMRLVLEADHAQGAAIWAVHRCLSPLLPFVDEAPEHGSYEAAEPCLGDVIQISERGFGNDDQIVMPTMKIVAEWSRLLVALERLHADLGEMQV